MHIEDIYNPTGYPKRDKFRRIFNKGQYVKDPDNPTYCDRPNCKCPLKHIARENLKLCDNCNNSEMPTIYKNKKLSYTTPPVLRE